MGSVFFYAKILLSYATFLFFTACQTPKEPVEAWSHWSKAAWADSNIVQQWKVYPHVKGEGDEEGFEPNSESDSEIATLKTQCGSTCSTSVFVKRLNKFGVTQGNPDWHWFLDSLCFENNCFAFNHDPFNPLRLLQKADASPAVISEESDTLESVFFAELCPLLDAFSFLPSSDLSEVLKNLSTMKCNWTGQLLLSRKHARPLELRLWAPRQVISRREESSTKMHSHTDLKTYAAAKVVFEYHDAKSLWPHMWKSFHFSMEPGTADRLSSGKRDPGMTVQDQARAIMRDKLKKQDASKARRWMNTMSDQLYGHFPDPKLLIPMESWNFVFVEHAE